MMNVPGMCDFEPMDVTLTMSFMVCRDHGGASAVGGVLQVPAEVTPDKAIATALGVLEQTIGGLLASHPQVEELISRKPMDDRAKNRVLTLLAHAHLMKLVAQADWDRPEGITFQQVEGP